MPVDLGERQEFVPRVADQTDKRNLPARRGNDLMKTLYVIGFLIEKDSRTRAGLLEGFLEVLERRYLDSLESPKIAFRKSRAGPRH